MPTVIKSKNPNEHKSIEYEVEEKVEEVLKKYDHKLNPSNSNISIGNEGLLDWTISIFFLQRCYLSLYLQCEFKSQI